MNTSFSKSEVKVEAVGLDNEDLVANEYASEVDQEIVRVGACHGEGEKDSGGPDFVHGGASKGKETASWTAAQSDQDPGGGPHDGVSQGGEYGGLKRVCQGGGGEVGAAISGMNGFITNVKTTNIETRRDEARSTFDLVLGDNVLEVAEVLGRNAETL